MTDLTATAPPATRAQEPDLGHPVRSFVLVLTLIGLVLLGFGASGAISPRLSTPATEIQEFPMRDGRTFYVVDLHNDGLLPVRVEEVIWSATGIDEMTLELVHQPRPDTLVFGEGAPARSFEIPAHGQVTIAVGGRPRCDASISVPRLRVSTWVGVVRTVEVPDLHPLLASLPMDACPSP